MATTVTTGALSLPANLAQGLIDKVETGSAVAALSASKPLLFGNTQVVMFAKHPRAEFVEEGAAKAPCPLVGGYVRAVVGTLRVWWDGCVWCLACLPGSGLRLVLLWRLCVSGSCHIGARGVGCCAVGVEIWRSRGDLRMCAGIL